jgi:hypothetical protein
MKSNKANQKSKLTYVTTLISKSKLIFWSAESKIPTDRQKDTSLHQAKSSSWEKHLFKSNKSLQILQFSLIHPRTNQKSSKQQIPLKINNKNYVESVTKKKVNKKGCF